MGVSHISLHLHNELILTPFSRKGFFIGAQRVWMSEVIVLWFLCYLVWEDGNLDTVSFWNCSKASSVTAHCLELHAARELAEYFVERCYFFFQACKTHDRCFQSLVRLSDLPTNFGISRLAIQHTASDWLQARGCCQTARIYGSLCTCKEKSDPSSLIRLLHNHSIHVKCC